MNWFIFFFIVAFSISIVVMVKKQKSAKEIGIVVTVLLLGFADWITIFMGRPFNPYLIIGNIIDWVR